MNSTHQIMLKVKCPVCGKSLMDPENKLDHSASIKMKIKQAQLAGYVWLSSVYGSYQIKCDIDIKENEVYEFSCPHCKALFSSEGNCDACSAPMNAIFMESGGKVKFCSRKGCTRHSVEFEDLSLALRQFYDNFDHYSGNTSEI